MRLPGPGYAIVLLVWGVPLHGQVLRGAVVEAISGQPVAGGLVQLLSGTDSVAAAAATNERGNFAFKTVAPGRYRLRALRIGYQAWTSPPFTLDSGQVRQDTLAIPAVPVVLEEITVETRSPCRASPSSDRRLALLWEEVRTALGVFGATSTDSLEFHSEVTRRFVDSSDHLSDERRSRIVGTGRWPVTSQAPESLAARGYVVTRDTLDGPVYYGPDVAVFFSDAFLRTHCFRLVPPPKQDRSVVGLGFLPVKGRPVTDIAGTLWLDRGSLELRTLEYHYAPLWEWVPQGRAGGALSFGRLASGELVITGWVIRAPVARIDRSPAGQWLGDEKTRAFFGRGRVALHGFREEMGVVKEVRRADGRVLWHGDS
jgi:hypothetical protein